jgi:hypothetical protein
MDPVINTRKSREEKLKDDDQFWSAVKAKIAHGPKRRAKNQKYSDAMLQKVQADRITNVQRKVESSNAQSEATKRELREKFLLQALEANRAELYRQRGIELTLSQYRAQIGL